MTTETTVIEFPTSALQRPEATAIALEDVATERVRQDRIFGVQRRELDSEDVLLTVFGEDASADDILSDLRRYCEVRAEQGASEWFGILLKEVFDAFDAKTPELIRHEMIQIAAVAVAIAEDIDSRGNMEGEE